MIRLKTEIHKDVLQKVILNPFGVEPGVSYKMMTSITAYRHNFFIEDLNLRHVVIRTYENTRVIIPNKIIDDAIVENRHNDKDMANMNFYYVGVAYGSDTDKAIKIVLDYLKKDALVLKKDLLSGLVFELKDSSIILRFGFYTKDQGDGFTVKCALNDFVLKAYKEANIEIPYNYLNVINHTA